MMVNWNPTEQTSNMGNSYTDARATVINIVGGDQHNVSLIEQNEFLQRIHGWLSPPDPSLNHNNACKKRQATTGNWFVEGTPFLKWKSILAPSFIWLHGILGCGKTILCSTIIEETILHCQNNASFAITYFYFDFKDEHKQHVENFIRSLIFQLSHQCNCIPSTLAALYLQCKDGTQQPPLKSLIKVLSAIMIGFRAVYIVIDALDECVDQEELVSFIDEITDWELDNLHILATSRREQFIEECLDSKVSCKMDLHSALVNADIKTCLRECLPTDPKLKKWSPEVQMEIEASLLQNANGMFRWVVCQLDVLRKCLKLDGLRKALKSLPKTLDETYDRILMNIDEQYIGDAFKVLQFLAFSARPVKIEEVAEVLAVDFDHHGGPRFNADLRLRDAEAILTICSSLVTTSGSEISPLITILHLSHFSVKEYLISPRIRAAAPARYGFNKRLADTFIAQSCLAYLLQFDKEDFLNWTTVWNFPLARYAAEHWVHHARSDDGDIPDALQPLIKELLEPQSSRFYNWVRLFDHCEFDKEEWMPKTDFTKSPSSIPSPFFYASLVGLEETLACLALDRRVDANEEFRGKAALEVAASQGYEAVVQILLDRGAGHPNNLALTGDSGCYSYALREALHGGHKAIVQLLLDHWEEDSYTLQWASSICHMEIVQLLLDKGVDINAQSQKYGSALTAASSRGYKTIVQLLLDNGANVNAQNGESKSALTAAPSEEIVQVLLGNPIELKVVQSLLNITPYASVRDVNIQDENYGNALTGASSRGYKEIVQLLLDKGADVNAQGGEHGSALSAAASSGHKEIVQLLLDKGADVNAQGGNYGSALSAASASGSKETLQLLLDKGADVNAQGGMYGSPLLAASASGSKETLQLLLDKGANVNSQVGWYGNALSAAVERGNREIVQLLLDRGADVNLQGGKYGTALIAASVSDNKNIVKLLLDKGADVNAQGEEDGTALIAASTRHGISQATVQLLLDYGADVNVQGGKYRTALIAASASDNKDIVKLLLDKGADINAQGGEDGTALLAASAGSSQGTVQLLLDYGADINALGGKYGNAQSAASYNRYTGVVHLLKNYQVTP